MGKNKLPLAILLVYYISLHLPYCAVDVISEIDGYWLLTRAHLLSSSDLFIQIGTTIWLEQ